MIHVFELLKDRKLNELARSEKTIREDVRLFNHLSESLRNKDLVEITESDIRKWLVKEYLHKSQEKKHLRNTYSFYARFLITVFTEKSVSTTR